MPVPVGLIISAVSALLKYRGRVDTILSLNETTRGLPFRLPPTPKVEDRTKFFSTMWAFFESTEGKTILEAQGLMGAFEAVKEAVNNDRDPAQMQLDLCYHLYFEAADIPSHLLAPTGATDAQLRQIASSGPNVEMRLAYYVVESHRLARNPVFARLALATVDTALEYFGENARCSQICAGGIRAQARFRRLFHQEDFPEPPRLRAFCRARQSERGTQRARLESSVRCAERPSDRFS